MEKDVTVLIRGTLTVSSEDTHCATWDDLVDEEIGLITVSHEMDSDFGVGCDIQVENPPSGPIDQEDT